MNIIPHISNSYHFFSGGGEMGKLIRATDWSKTALGDPKDWPQSLRTMVNVMLDNPFGMYIAWGSDYIQIYNDSYRPILGTTKHPQALGISSRETFAEIWNIIGSMFDDVMKGKATGFPDFMLPLNRNGFVEECYFDFSYSPIRKDNGEVGGVLVTVIETSDKRKAINSLKESEVRFKQIINGLPLVVWTASPDGNLTYISDQWEEFYGNPVSESLGAGWTKYVHPDDIERAGNLWAHSIKTGVDYESEFRVHHKSGQYQWILVRAISIRNEEGKIISWNGSNTNIQEKKLNEVALQKSELLVRTVVESSPFPLGVYIGKEMRIELANRSILDTWGKGNNVIHKIYREILPELENQEIFNQLDNVYNTGLPFHAENQAVNLMIDGKLQTHYFNYSFMPLFDVSGKVYGIVNSAANVTDLNLAKQKIQESESKLRNTILQAPVAMCILMGAEYVVELANDLMFELWGKKSEQVMNKPLFEGVYEAKNQGFEDLIGNVYNTGETVSAQGVPVSLNRHGKVEQAYVNVLYQPYRDTNNFISGVLAVATDVTSQIIARKKIEEAEEKARLAINSAALGVYEIIYATDEIITDKRFNEIWGIDYPATRKQYAAVIHPDDLAHRIQAHKLSLTTGQLDYQARVIWKDNSIRWVRITGKLLYDDKRNPLKLIGIIQDITAPVTARHKIEEVVTARTKDLADANQNLQKSNAELAQFAYIASHDLQEPLRKISTFTQMLENNLAGKIDERSRNFLDKINYSSSRMHALIRDVLTYSELVRENEIFVEVNLNTIVENIKNDYDLLIEQKEATLQYTDLPTVEAIPLQMSQLFNNLVGNALKFAKKDLKPIISIWSTKLTTDEVNSNPLLIPDGEYYKIVFEDNGIGFMPEYSEQIFNIFQRLHRRSEYEGTGIGLSMCKKIALNHHGDLNAFGSTENGAVFNAILPVKQLR